MGVELFGGDYILYYAVACFVAYYCSGHTSIYDTKRLGVSKSNGANFINNMLKQIRNERFTK
jgi:hypothetical protein